MCEEKKLDRRDMMKLLAAAGLSGFAAAGSAGPGALIPGKGWAETKGACEGDGTPLQFIPKTAPDPKPLENELEKYPKCPYCGMDRKQWHHSRHLVHYSDGLVDGTCSVHCLAISLTLNLDRGPKGIYAADFGSTEEIKPMIPADSASYLIGSKLPGTMSKKSKMAFASAEAAKIVQAQQGGHIGNFDDAMRSTYLSMHTDTMMIRHNRAEKRRMMQKKLLQRGG